ncbi:hypothetical protein E2C01_058603 [Portunus trituberculatus]|uniref:Uncharacterized protein n=1 Tax=Portunus trituberculatus TaxID=210409 RepID=A0A5B7H560_PORTR|nr:hypothetical protein [Portunus trituberculatus]
MDLSDDDLWISQEGAIGLMDDEAAREAVKPEKPRIECSEEEEIESLEREVDVLRRCVQDLIFKMQHKEDEPANEKPIKTFLKP